MSTVAVETALAMATPAPSKLVHTAPIPVKQNYALGYGNKASGSTGQMFPRILAFKVTWSQQANIPAPRYCSNELSTVIEVDIHRVRPFFPSNMVPLSVKILSDEITLPRNVQHSLNSSPQNSLLFLTLCK